MKATFQDFLEEHTLCKKFACDDGAIRTFDFLSADENIIDMLDFSDVGKPALLGCLSALEAFYDEKPSPTFDFTDKFVRSSVGRMVATIIAPFGYLPVAQVNFSPSNRGKYFGSANRYEKKGDARMHVSKVTSRFNVDKRQINVYLAKTAGSPIDKEHLLIASFLNAMDDENETMIAHLGGVEEKFYALLKAKGGKRKEEKFREVLEELSFTAFSHIRVADADNFFEREVFRSQESGVFPFGTVFEIFTDLIQYADDVIASTLIDNYIEPAKYERSSYGEHFYLKVSDVYYDSLSKYMGKFNYDACMRVCEAHRQKKEDEE